MIPLWLQVAIEEIGIKEIEGPDHHPRIIEYHDTTSGFSADEVPWCGSFVAWCFTEVGIIVPNRHDKAQARNWTRVGRKLDKPKMGCITVLWRGYPDADSGHVGFYIHKENNSIFILGGNQKNSVNIMGFNQDRLLDYRWLV